MELLERKTQLDELNGLLRQAVSGRGSLLFLGGEAGVGKSSLIRVFSEAARSRCRMLTGACDPLSTPRPHGPLIDMSEQLGSEIAALVVSPASRTELFNAVLADLASETTLMVIEDAHWADEGTLDLLRYLGRRIGHSPALIVVTYRDDEVGTNHPLRRVLGDLVTAEAVRRMGLRPLSLHAVATMVRETGLDAVAIHHQTNGNPFFITEVIAAGQAGPPETVRDAVLARASRLSSDGRALLDVVAVIGSPAEPWLVAQVREATDTVVEECIDAGMLLSEGLSLSFRHELARRSVLDSISATRQIDLNSRVLDALQASGSQNMARLAHHAAASFDRAAVLEYGIAAAENAVSLHAHRQAADQYARVLTFADDLPPRRKGDLLIACATESLMAEDLAAALSSCQRALDIWRLEKDHLREGDALRRLSRILWYSGRNAEAEAAGLESVSILEQLPPGPELAMAYSTQSQLRMLSWEREPAIAWGQKAIALAEQLGEVETLIHALSNVGAASFLDGSVEQHEDLVKRALELALEHGFEEHAARAYALLGSGVCEMYRFADADPNIAAGIAFATEHDLDQYRHYLLAWQATSDLYQGRWTRAADLANSVLRQPGIAPITRIVADTVVGRVMVRKGETAASDTLDNALDLALQTGELQRLCPVRTARAELAFLAGDLDRVRAEVESLFAPTLQSGHIWYSGQIAFWLWRAGALSVAPHGIFEPFALQIAGNWREAAARWRALGCPYETASALAESNDESDLRYALAEFDRLGAAPMAALVSARLRTMTEQRIRRGVQRPEPHFARPETRYARSGDVHIAYQVIGEGPLDLVFVMGWVSHLEYFWEGPSARFLRRLASFSRLIIFDKRGTGLSDRVAELPTMEQRMDDVRAVMDAAGCERAALFGISEGAAMCMMFAATYPEKTTALIVYGGYAKRVWSPEYPWAPTALERQEFYDAIEQGWGGVVDLDTLAPTASADPQFREWWSTYLRRSASPGAALALARMNTEIDVRQILPAIRVPALIMHRTGDLDIHVGGARYMAERIPGATYVELPGVDHLVFAGDQTAILDEVELFLTGSHPLPQADRVLVTIVAVEITGEGERAGGPPNPDVREVINGFNREVDQELEIFRGERIGSSVSGFLAAFDGPGRAIRFAGAVVAVAERLGFQSRAGIHTGECERLDGGMTGLPLQYAAEILAHAGAGQVIVSTTVKDLVAGSGIEFETFGTLEIETFPGGLTLYQVARESKWPRVVTTRFTPEIPAQQQTTGRLSRRETEIARLITEGLSNRQIAAELSISPATVERHVSNIFNKLGYHSRAKIAAWVVEHHSPADRTS